MLHHVDSDLKRGESTHNFVNQILGYQEWGEV